MLDDQTRALVTDHRYPTTTAHLIEAHGDHRVRFTDGEERLGAILDRTGEETFARSEDLEAAVLSGLPTEAVGRRGYTDRDPPVAGEVWRDVSF